MKKIFTNPRLTIIEIDEKDIVATSDPTIGYEGEDGGNGVAQSRQRNPIWDDWD